MGWCVKVFGCDQEHAVPVTLFQDGQYGRGDRMFYGRPFELGVGEDGYKYSWIRSTAWCECMILEITTQLFH
jgi:hypothetical protein